MNLYVIDLETTGLRRYPKDVPLEVSVVEIDFENGTTHLVYESLISHDIALRDKIDSCYWVKKLKGLPYNELSKNGAPLKDVFGEVFRIIDGKYVTSWNTIFDLSFLAGIRDELFRSRSFKVWNCPMRTSAKYLKIPMYRTARYGGSRRVGNKWPKLNEAARFYGVDITGTGLPLHRSSCDAVVAAQIILQMAARGHYSPP